MADTRNTMTRVISQGGECSRAPGGALLCAMLRMAEDSVHKPLIMQSSRVLPDPGDHHEGLSGTRPHVSIDVGPGA